MIKKCFISIWLLIISFIMCTKILDNTKTIVKRSESTASIKGFETSNLTYLSDSKVYRYKMASSSNHYGYVSMWSSVYKVIINENNTTSCYVIGFVESYIESVGKVSSKYFRNKRLEIDVHFECDREAQLVNYFPSSSESSNVCSKSIGITASKDSNGAGLEASFGFEKSIQYDSVTTTIYTKGDNLSPDVNYVFDFLNYKDGAMVSPNCGQVRQKIAVVYQIPKYLGTEVFKMSFRTQANIFKDATWPMPNNELAGEIFDFFDGTNYVESMHSEKLL